MILRSRPPWPSSSAVVETSHWKSSISPKRHIHHRYNTAVYVRPRHQHSYANSNCDRNTSDNAQDNQLALDREQTSLSSCEHVINAFGSTRFDVAVRALRGEFDPAPNVANTERSVGLLMDSLVQWPLDYPFQLVVRNDAEDRDGHEALVEEYRRLVESMCATTINPDTCSWKLRKGGKYVSICIPAAVTSQRIISDVFEALEGDQRVLMKY
jgi:putative lipoic acid-binding regulatory protein